MAARADAEDEISHEAGDEPGGKTPSGSVGLWLSPECQVYLNAMVNRPNRVVKSATRDACNALDYRGKMAFLSVNLTLLV